MTAQQLSRLKEIAEKDEVIDTVQAQHLKQRPREVEQQYLDHLQTHLSLGDTSDTESQLLTNLEQQTGTIGIIAGKYAYGKTSTAISFWESSERAGYVAVPPFIFTSLNDLLEATTGWLEHRLSDRYTDRIWSLYEKYQQKGVDELASETGEEHDIEVEKASELITSLRERGQITEDLPAEVLVEFFIDATELVEDAGYEGLIVYADEVQQFFKKRSYSEAEEELRSLIWGFNPREISFGMMFAIPDEQLAVINERGSDILDRIREDNLLLNLTSVYDNAFPQELWDYYAEEYNFADIKSEIIQRETLSSIGQYATREDLGRGPRTVIDAFGYAVTEYINSDTTLTPVEFIDAYIEGRLRFTEPQQKVRTAVADVESVDVVKTEDHRRAIKLMAAFPKGVPQEVAETYGLDAAIDELSSELHGTLLTFYADGYTLVDIVKGDPDVTVGGEILRDFWREFQEDDEDVANAIAAFDEFVLPELLPDRGRGQSRTGWTVRESNKLHRHTYESYREGTFDLNYPNRRLYISVTGRHRHLGKVDSKNNLDSDAHLRLGFFLDHEYLAEERITEIEENAAYQFVLDLNETLMKGDLPKRIRKLKDYMNPRSVTPLLMLALITRIDNEIAEAADNMALAEKQSLENLRKNLVTETIEVLFDDELREQAPDRLQIRRLRGRMVEDLFREVMQTRYPDYHTLYKGRSITKFVGEYTSALDSSVLNLALTQKQGKRPVVVSKNNLGEAFNVKNDAPLRNKLTDKYEDLIDLEWDYSESTNDVKITFCKHPLEEAILDAFASDEAGETVADAKARSLATEKGYTEEEYTQILRILKARQYIDEEGEDLVRIETTLDKEEIESDLDQIESQLSILPSGTNSTDNLRSQASTLRDQLDDAAQEDQETLEEIRESVTSLRRSVTDELESQHRKLLRGIEELADNVASLQRQAQANQLEKVEIPATFSRHLNKQRTKINNEYETIKTKAGDLEEKANKLADNSDEVTIASVEQLQDGVENIQSRYDQLKDDIDDLNAERDGYEDWRSVAGKAHDLDERIMRFTDRSGEVEFQDKLERVLTRIGEHFSEHGRDLLLRADTYDDEIKQIQEEFDERVGQKRQAFESEKESLHQVLQTARGSYPGLRAQFSESDPDQSYANLETEVLEAINEDILEELEETLDDVSRTVSRAQRFQTIPSEVDLDEFEARVDDARGEFEEIHRKLDDWSIDDGHDALVPIGEQIGDLRSDIETLSEDIEKLNRPVRPESEEHCELYEMLEYGTTVQLDTIIDLANDDTDPEEVAADLAELFKRNLLDIQIRKRFRELPDE